MDAMRMPAAAEKETFPLLLASQQKLAPPMIARIYPDMFIGPYVLESNTKRKDSTSAIICNNASLQKQEREQKANKEWEELRVYGYVFSITRNFIIRIPSVMSLETALMSEKPHVIYSSFKALTHFRNMTFSNGGGHILNSPNAGGTSTFSEVLSFEFLRVAFGAQLIRSEMEIQYKYSHCKITDMLINLFNTNVGVSVTRAMRYKAGDFSVEDAKRLLIKKLHGVNCSTHNAANSNRWTKQILHCFCMSESVAKVLYRVYKHQISHSLKSNTILLLTVVDVGNAPWIFFEYL